MQEACDRAAQQLARSKELEEKAREENEVSRDRLERNQLDYRRLISEKETLSTENERLKYEVERYHNTQLKNGAVMDSLQEETAMYKLELEKSRDRYEKVQSELRRLEEAEAYSRDTRKIKEENERLRERLEKTMNELDTLRNTIQFDQESFEKLKERIGQRENDAQSLEAKLHEATLQLERSRSEIAKLISNQVSFDGHLCGTSGN